MRKKIFLVVIACFVALQFCYSQSVVSNGGDSHRGSRTTLDWTVGELMVERYRSDRAKLTQGFHQTSLVINSVFALDELVKIQVYPNPTQDFINIEVEENMDFKVRVYDTNTRLVHETGNVSNQYSLDFNSYPAGSYFLHIINKDLVQKTYKIIKQ